MHVTSHKQAVNQTSHSCSSPFHFHLSHVPLSFISHSILPLWFLKKHVSMVAKARTLNGIDAAL